MSTKYERIAQELRLTLGNSRLPTEAQLCSQYGCSRRTVRAALRLLEEQGLIVRRQGSGSYPVKSTVQPPRRQIYVVLADREEYTTPSVLRELGKAAREAGFDLRCLETRGERAREAEHLRTLRRQRPAGVILEPITDVLGCFHPELLTALTEVGIPVVTLYGSYGQTVPAVFPDEKMGAEKLISHLATVGHRQLAAILKWDDSRGLRRFRALSAAAERAGARLETTHCLWYGESERRRLLEGDERMLCRFRDENLGDCTAIICFNDEIGFRLHHFLQSKGEIRSIVSYDNSYLAQPASLTSLSCAGLPSAAFAALLQQITGSSTHHVLPSWRIFIRHSG